jgi:hypothetical protein
VAVVDYKPDAVRAAPNESRIRGRIINVAPGPEGVGQVWKVKVEGAEDVGPVANFGRGRVGEVISVLVHPYLKKRFSKSDLIEARVSFQGDEAGGDFFLMGEDIRRLG